MKAGRAGGALLPRLAGAGGRLADWVGMSGGEPRNLLGRAEPGRAGPGQLISHVPRREGVGTEAKCTGEAVEEVEGEAERPRGRPGASSRGR